MSAILFLGIGALFIWLIYKALSTQEIKGRGWGFGVRIFDRNSEPMMYWVTLFSYMACAILATITGVLMSFRAFSKVGT